MTFVRPVIRAYLVVSGLLYGVVALIPMLVVGSVLGWPPSASVVGAAGVAVVAASRGVLVRVQSGPAGLRIINRWRSVDVPWDELLGVRRGSLVAYSLADALQRITSEVDAGTVEIHGGVLVVDRIARGDGARLGVPVSALATLWCSPTEPRLVALLDDVRLHGGVVDLERTELFEPPTTGSAGPGEVGV